MESECTLECGILIDATVCIDLVDMLVNEPDTEEQMLCESTYTQNRQIRGDRT